MQASKILSFLGSPSLAEATRTDVDILCSRSGPVMAAARKQHNEAISRLRLPWWQSLNEDSVELDMQQVKEKLKEFSVLEELEKQF